MKEMKMEVDCYSGRTADERPIRFLLDEYEYLVQEAWTIGTVRQMAISKSVRMTEIGTSCAGRHPRRMAFGIWNHSGNCRAIEG